MENECVNDIGRVKIKSMDCVAVEGEMQIVKKKELTAEKGDLRILSAKLSPGENDDDPMHFVATWKNVNMADFKNADKADDVQLTKINEG